MGTVQCRWHSWLAKSQYLLTSAPLSGTTGARWQCVGRRYAALLSTHLQPEPNATRDQYQAAEQEYENAHISKPRPHQPRAHGSAFITSHRTDEALLQRILSRECTFEELRTQCDAASERGDLLVDHPEYRGDVRLWVELTQFRRRLQGSDGVLEIWAGMRRREVDLPVEGEKADFLWEAFISAASYTSDGVREDVLEDLYSHALELRDRTGRSYQHLYSCFVGASLRLAWHRMAHRWHRALVAELLATPDALKDTIIDVVKSARPDWALKIFKDLYKYASVGKFYDTCIAKLLDAGEEHLALSLHQYLLRRGDVPSSETFKLPGVQKLFDMDKDKSLPAKLSKDSAKLSQNRPVSHHNHLVMSRASMSGVMGDVHGIRPKEISDTFVAKMFATQAFPFDLVMKSLSFFAVEKLGPLALREMAIRAGSASELHMQLEQLNTNAITVSDAVYCRVLQDLANNGRDDVLSALLASDQHPEAFENPQIQEEKLVSSLETGNTMQMQIALLALSLAGKEVESRAWNRVFQHHCRTRNHASILATMQMMKAEGMPLTRKTIRCLMFLVLPQRKRGRREWILTLREKAPFSQLDFVTAACMYEEQQRRTIDPRVWRELLKRHGMAGHRWDALERLVLWLAERYTTERFRIWREITARGGDRTEGTVVTPTLRAKSPAHEIFDKQMLQAIFTWGLRSAAERQLLRPVSIDNTNGGTSQWSEDDPSAHIKFNVHNTTDRQMRNPEPWAQGLHLLARLKAYGIPIKIKDVQVAFAVRMWILFGPGVSSLKVNQRDRSNNMLDLRHYIQHAHAIWPEHNGLFPDLFDQNDGEMNEADLLMLLRERYIRNSGSITNTMQHSVRGRRKVISWFGHLHIRPRFSPWRERRPGQSRARSPKFSASFDPHLSNPLGPVKPLDSLASSPTVHAPPSLASHSRPPRRWHQSLSAHSES